MNRLTENGCAGASVKNRAQGKFIDVIFLEGLWNCSPFYQPAPDFLPTSGMNYFKQLGTFSRKDCH
ncbi:hypothetical protein ACTUVN_004878 [Pseudomonas caspiana]